MRTRHLLLLLTLCLAALGGLQAQQISLDQARQTAEQFMRQRTGLRAHVPLQLLFTVNDTTQLDVTAHLRTSHSDDALLYAFSQGDEGYVIASGDERARAIVAYGTSGTLDIHNLPDGMRELLRQYAVEIETVRSNEEFSTSIIQELSYDPNWTPVEPLITSMWGQEEPYNRQTPEANGKQTVTGCPATMMAQLMDYYHYQNWQVSEETWFAGDTISKSFINRDVTVTFDSPVDWSLLKRTYTTGNYSKAEANEVAKLMKYTGAAMHIKYGTGASGIDARDVLQNIDRVAGYGKQATFAQAWQYPLRTWSEKIYRQLAAGRPMPYASVGGGHIFLLDGYQREGFFHFNWGWEGKSNDYFLLSALLTDRNMHIGQVAIFDCCPNTMAAINQETVQWSQLTIDTTGEVPSLEILLTSLHSGLQTGQFRIALVGGEEIEPILSDTIDFAFTPNEQHQSDVIRVPFPQYSQLDQAEYALALYQRMGYEWIQMDLYGTAEKQAYLVRHENVYQVETRDVSMQITLLDAPTQCYIGEEVQVTLSVESSQTGMALTSFAAFLFNDTDTVGYKLDDVFISEKKQQVTIPIKFNKTKEGIYQLIVVNSARNVSQPVTIELLRGAELVLTQPIELADTLYYSEEYPVTYHIKNIGERDFEGTVQVYLTSNDHSAYDSFGLKATIPKGEEVILEDLLYWFGDPMEGYLTLLQEGTWNIPLEDGTYYYKPVVVIDEPTANEAIATAGMQISWQGENLVITASNPIDRYAIFDMAGKSVATATVQATTTQINGSSWPAGIYVVVVKKQDGQVVTKKIRK